MFLTRIMSAVCLTLMLGACATTQPVVVHNTATILPEDVQLQDCPVEPPPEEKAFLAMDKDEKIVTLSKAYKSQTLNVGECNIDKRNLRLWKKKQLDRVGRNGK